MPEELILFQKFYDFVLLIYPAINRIPKSHRQILGKELERVSILLLTSITQANKQFGEVRKNNQKEISQNLDVLRILIRLTKDLKFMSIGQYCVLIEKIDEIGKLLYGWIKS